MAVAQLAERRDVAPEVAGSSPVGHPLSTGTWQATRECSAYGLLQYARL